jgi:hypothetical protein
MDYYVIHYLYLNNFSNFIPFLLAVQMVPSGNSSKIRLFSTANSDKATPGQGEHGGGGEKLFVMLSKINFCFSWRHLGLCSSILV